MKLVKDFQANPYAMPDLKDLSSSGQAKSRASKASPETIEREAFEKGFASGEKAGLEMGKQKAELIIDRLKNVLRDCNTLKEKMLSEFEPQVILLAIAMARKILKEQISDRPEIHREMIEAAIQKISKNSSISIRLNRPLYELLINEKEKLQTIFPDILFELDNQIPEGGAIVRSQSEEVQTDLDYQLSIIIEELRNQLGHG